MGLKRVPPDPTENHPRISTVSRNVTFRTNSSMQTGGWATWSSKSISSQVLHSRLHIYPNCGSKRARSSLYRNFNKTWCKFKIMLFILSCCWKVLLLLFIDSSLAHPFLVPTKTSRVTASKALLRLAAKRSSSLRPRPWDSDLSRAIRLIQYVIQYVYHFQAKNIQKLKQKCQVQNNLLSKKFGQSTSDVAWIQSPIQ